MVGEGEVRWSLVSQSTSCLEGFSLFWATEKKIRRQLCVYTLVVWLEDKTRGRRRRVAVRGRAARRAGLRDGRPGDVDQRRARAYGSVG